MWEMEGTSKMELDQLLTFTDEELRDELHGVHAKRLIEIILFIRGELQENSLKLEEALNTLSKFQVLIEKNITTAWTWERIQDKLMKTGDVFKGYSFLVKVLKEKGICTNAQCPIFPELSKIKKEIFKLKKSFKAAFSPRDARKKLDLGQFNQWKQIYWKIRYMESEALEEIQQLGIPNETKKENFFEIRNFVNQKHIEIIDACDEATIDISPGKEIDYTMEADNEQLTSEDFKDYGNDIFGERRQKILEARRKRREQQGGKNSKKGELMELDERDALPLKIKKGAKHGRKSH